MHIYCITNLVNGKIYIGRRLHDDLPAYLRDKLRHKYCKRLHRALHKYGIKNFTIRSLVRPIDEPQANELEKFFIRVLDSQNPDIGYNILAGGRGALGRVVSEETRNRMRKVGNTFSPQCREAQKVWARSRKGIPCSEERRKNISAALTGVPQVPRNKGKKFGPRPEEVKQAIREKLKGRKRPPEVVAKMVATRKKNKEACLLSNKTEIQMPFSTLQNLPAAENLNLSQQI